LRAAQFCVIRFRALRQMFSSPLDICLNSLQLATENQEALTTRFSEHAFF